VTVSLAVGKDAGTYNGTLNVSTNEGAAKVVNVELNVRKAAITIKADSWSIGYDGTVHKVDRFSIVSGALISGDAISSIAYVGEITYVGNVTSSVSEAVIKNGEYEHSQNYEITYESGQLTVTPISLVLKSEHQTKVYDGEKLDQGDVIIVDGKLALSERLVYHMTVSQTDVGQSGNYFWVVIYHDNVDVTSNYSITRIIGTLEVTAKPVTPLWNYYWDDTTYDITYDGKQHLAKANVDGKVDGDDLFLLYDIQNKFTNSGIYKLSIDCLSGDDKGNYSLLLDDSNSSKIWTINKAAISITAQKTTISYGSEIPNYEAVINGITPSMADPVYKLISGYKKGSDIGNYDIYVSYSSIDNPNYYITSVDSTLVVETLPIIIEWTEDAVYDGNQHFCKPHVVNLCNTDNVSLGVNYVLASAVGSYEMEVTSISNSNYTLEKAVNNNYIWHILPRPISLEWSVDKEFEYDGDIHTVNAKVTNLVNNESVVLTYDDNSSRAVGKHCARVTGIDNTSYTANGSTGNDFEWTITKIKLTITVAPATRPYDGSPLTSTYNVAGLRDGDTIGATCSGSQTEVGFTTCSVADIVVQRNGEAMSENYDITVVPATLMVSKRDVILTSASRSWTYDGTVHSAPEVAVTGSGFVDGEGADFTFVAGQLEKGNCQNEFSWTLWGGTHAENYNITAIFGTVAVTARETKASWNSWGAGSFSAVYDGSVRTATAVPAGMIGGDDLRFEYGTASFSGTGTFTASITGLTGADAFNYCLADDGLEQEYVVVPRTAEISWGDLQFVRDGMPKEVTATVSNPCDGDEFAIELSGHTASEAGSYTATVVSLGNKCYTLDGASKTSVGWSICNATLTILLECCGHGSADVDSLAVEEGSLIAGLSSVNVTSDKGYAFDGWYTASEGGEPVTSESTADEGTTVLFAHYHEVVSAGMAWSMPTVMSMLAVLIGIVLVITGVKRP
jgi:hypothetical protein